MRKFILIGTLLIIIIILAGGWFGLSYKNSQEPGVSVNNFEECIAKGYPVLESYPRQCRTPDGKIFVEDIGAELGYFIFVKMLGDKSKFITMDQDFFDTTNYPDYVRFNLLLPHKI